MSQNPVLEKFSYGKPAIEIRLPEKDILNLSVLLSTDKNNFAFTCNNQGHLQPMSFWQRAFYWLSSKFKIFSFYKNKVDRQVSTAVNSLVSNLKMTNITGGTEDVNTELKELFFERLSQLPTNVFDRSKIDPPLLERLQELHFAKDNSVKQFADVPQNGKPDFKEHDKSFASAAAAREHYLWNTHFNFALGNYAAIGEGTSSAYRVLDAAKQNSTISIIKPGIQEPLASGNRRWLQFFKRLSRKTILLPFNGMGFDMMAGQGYVAEKANSIVADLMVEAIKAYVNTPGRELTVAESRLRDKISRGEMPLTIVAPTEINSFKFPHIRNPVRCSVQQWINVDKVMSGEGFFQRNIAYHSNDSLISNPQAAIPNLVTGEDLKKGTISNEAMDLIAILHAATGNLDGHLGNWMVEREGNGEITHGEMAYGLWAIDGGLSMGPDHPYFHSFFDLKNFLLWRKLNEAQQPFSELGTFIIKYMIENQLRLAGHIRQLYLAEEHRINKPGMQKANLKVDQRVIALSERIIWLQYYADGKKSDLYEGCSRPRVDKIVEQNKKDSSQRIHFGPDALAHTKAYLAKFNCCCPRHSPAATAATAASTTRKPSTAAAR